ncbi:MAG: alanine racemase [Caulobacter sp.]|nr:alanine racemase [Caulobacter sp.]
MTVARLTIDLDALARNYAFLRGEAGVETAPAVKADGYGLGAQDTALRLWREGARSFHVARLEEGEFLRDAFGDRDATLYVLDGATPGSATRLEAARLVPVLNSLEQAAAWTGPAALHIDTGMNRLGLSLDEAVRLRDRAGIRLVMSHLACAAQADHTMNGRQLARFRQARALFPGVPASLAGSSGIRLGRDYAFDQVRPGVSLFGGGPNEGPDPRLSAVATLEAAILQVRQVPAGDTIGYGAAFTAETDLTVAVLAAGYADGVLRSAHPAGAVWFDGARRAILGRVSMDTIVIDVTGSAAAKPGAMAEIIGPNLPLDDAATAAGTTAYELLTRLSGRAERRFIGAA